MATTNIIVSDVLKATQVYTDFVSKVVAFVFENFTGLEEINGIPIASITAIPHVSGRVKFETLDSYTAGSEWPMPADHLGQFTNGADIFYIVFGFINSSGYALTTAGTCGADITLTVDNTSIPSALTNCKMDGLPSRLDCDPVDVTTIYDLPGYSPGQVPVS